MPVEPIAPGQIPCPFVYANGKKCTGHVVRVAAYKADISWNFDRETGTWGFHVGEPRSHYHLFCSEKENHAGVRGDDSRMKYYYQHLPEQLRSVVESKEQT